MHIPILNDILIILLSAVFIVYFLKKVKLPSILGFIVTGILIGPYALGFIQAPSEIEQMSEIGVLLLLFVIGMELSIKELWAIKKNVFIGGSIQVGLTIFLFSLLYYLVGFQLEEAVFAGFIFSLSSTAIVLKLFQDRYEMHTQHAKNALAILIFQDIIVVPMLLLIPILAGEVDNPIMSSFALVLKTALLICFTWIASKYIIPKLFLAVAKADSKELFLLVTISFCLLVSSITSLAGMSPALGAFIAGLIIAESNYSYQATSFVLPFRELFTSLFFVSVGMLLDLHFFAAHMLTVFGLVFLVLVIKSALIFFAVYIMKYPMKTALLVGLSLFQVGEFSFILSKAGLTYGLINAQQNQYFLSVSIVSMLLTPFVFMASENISIQILRLKNQLSKKVESVYLSEQINFTTDQPHLVIIGFGVNGSNLATAANTSQIPYVIVDFDARLVKNKYQEGYPIIFGDASQESILEAIDIHNAKVVVVAISNIKETKHIVELVRVLNKQAYIIVRTRYIKEMGELFALGADDVIPEEYETSLQIFTKVLGQFDTAESEINEIAERVRNDHYQLFLQYKNVKVDS